MHPNDHVNCNQSTNDTFPAACHIAILNTWPSFKKSADQLVQSLQEKESEFAKTPFLARTCLQDAVETRLGDLITGWRVGIARRVQATEQAIDHLNELAIGATVVGRRDDVPDAYHGAIIRALREVTGHKELAQAESLWDAAQNPDHLIAVFSELELLARMLIRIARDLRLLSSGPEGGFGELELPAVLPGSSAMPGKINPCVPEFVMQVGFTVIGARTAAAAAVEHGELNLNVWESLVLTHMLDSFELLNQAIVSLDQYCISDLKARDENCRNHSQSLTPRIVELKKQHGYQKISKICREADGDPQRLKQLLDQI